MGNPRFMLAAGASGSGKTLITCGILAALGRRGLKVSSFKCGPDYIDPMFHARILKAKSRNLDTFFTNPAMTRYLFARSAKGTDVSVMEGVMGYYDGLGGTTEKAGAWDLARTTDTPAVLIVNAKGMSLSLLAYIKGFLTYREDSRIRGVILNQISPMLYPKLRDKIQEELKVRVYGFVPKLTDFSLDSRHLGLVLPGEIANLEEKFAQLGETLEKTLDLDGLLALADTAPQIPEQMPEELEALLKSERARKIREAAPKIAVAKDEAFCFLYEDNLQLLKDLGARLCFFSPIHDERIPADAEGLLLYGGYPELYARELAENASMRESIREGIAGGLPHLAECGGFLYLHEELEDMNGQSFPGCANVAGKGFRTPKLSRFGYVTLEAEREGLLGGEGPIKGHEFHYFDSTSCGEDFTARKPLGGRSWKCIHAGEAFLEGFPHLYYYSRPEFAAEFLEKCAEFGRKEP